MPNKSKQTKSAMQKGIDKVNKVPVARGVSKSASRPVLGAKGGCFRVSHCEFVGSLTNASTTGYALTALSSATPGYDLNPASQILFPWLSGLAPSFERFRFTRMNFKFVPSSPTTTAGRFYAAVDYDYDDAVAASKAQLMGNSTSIEVPVWMETSLSCIVPELHRDQPWKYVSLANRGNFVEPRTAFCGYLMCAFDTPTANLLYDLWVEYDIEFVLPVVEYGIVGVGAPVDHVVADVTHGAGATKFGFPTLSDVANSVVKLVTPGNGFVPQLNLQTLYGAYRLAAQAYDISGLKKTSSFDINTVLSVTGVTPANVLLAGLTPGNSLFDGAGNYLGVLAPDSLAAGPSDPLDTATAGEPVGGVCSYFAKSLFDAYPTARYVVPFVASTVAALGAGTLGAGMKVEL